MADLGSYQTEMEEDDFNDLTRRPTTLQNQHSADGSDDHLPPKAKRIACVLCRKRKLKCDGARPSCGTCTRLSHDCSYDEVRKKSGPRKGYVRSLESRLAQVEELLKTQDAPETTQRMPPAQQAPQQIHSAADPTANVSLGQLHLVEHGSTDVPVSDSPYFVRHSAGQTSPLPDMGLVGLGLEEALPEQDVQEELDRIYFEKVHPTSPLIHPGRYYAGLKLAPQARPATCLRYAMWAMTASLSDKYEALQDHFYQRARKYVQLDEMRGHGEQCVTVQHVQTWYLICMIEFKMTYFPRAWLSSGRASRLALMMGLNRLDRVGIDVKQCLPPPRDWTDKEERRRTFWLVFQADRFASIGTGWPMTIDESDVHTHLPSDLDSFEMSREVPGIVFQQALEPHGAGRISGLAGVCLLTCLFGRNLVHLHRGTPDDNEANLNGKFWLRHRALDNTILNISLSLPEHLRMPAAITDQNAIFTNLCIHTSTICLHQAAIFKADSNGLPASVSAESKVRCITSAAEVASIMRLISHTDLTLSNPFSTFCLYVAARVFVQYLKSRPSDNNVKASLHFLLTAMQAMRRKNLLTESLLIQLDIDLQGADLEDLRSLRNRLSKMTESASSTFRCPDLRAEPVAAQAQAGKPDKAVPTKKGRTFGDSGLAGVLDPNAAERGVRQTPSDLGRVHSISSLSSGQTPAGDIDETGRWRFMAHRGKTPSTRPSPATVSDDVMDIAFDDSASPESLAAQSSHTSSGTNTSQTPPISANESQSAFSSKPSPNFDMNNMSNAEFQAMMNELAAGNIYNMDPASTVDPLSVMFGGVSEGTAFTLPNLPMSPNGFDFDGGSGLTPLPSGDDNGLTAAELDEFLDASAVDMGWKRGFPDNAVQLPVGTWPTFSVIEKRIREHGRPG